MAVERSLERLLEPSLGAQVLKPPYSVRAGFLVAFFGGPFASIGLAALNSQRNARLKRDGWFLALLVLAVAALVIGVGVLSRSPPVWLPGGTERRFFIRALALLVFGAVFLRHRSLYAASELRGEDAPPAWGVGILACVVGNLVQAGMASLGVLLGGQ